MASAPEQCGRRRVLSDAPNARLQGPDFAETGDQMGRFSSDPDSLPGPKDDRGADARPQEQHNRATREDNQSGEVETQ